MSEVMLGLGDYRFSIGTAAYERLVRSDVWRWATQERILGEPLQQFIGPGAATVELSGTIYPHYKGGLGQIDDMRAEADKGEPLRLVDDRGTVWRKWVIERIEETQTRFLPNGAPLKIEFRLSLKRYGEEG